MIHPIRKLKFLVLTVAAMVSIIAAPLFITAKDTGKSVMKVQVPNAAQHGILLSHKNEAEKIQLLIDLKLRDSGTLDALINDLYNPASPNYKQFLTPDQFDQRFGPTAEDAGKVQHFILARGLKIDEISSDRTYVKVSGTAKQVEKAFGVTINNYKNDKGKKYYANINSPQLPSELGNMIAGIHGLDNEPHLHRSAVNSRKPQLEQTHLSGGPKGGYTPSELRSAYDMDPLISAGYNGSGQTVALYENDGFIQSNIETYNNYYGLGSPAPSVVLVDGYNGEAGAGQGEVELDIEVINALAPKAKVIVYEGSNETDAGVVDTYRKIATENRAKSVSISWGLCELQNSTSTMNSMHAIFQQMASQGQSVFAATGDSGAYDCQDSQLAVDSPANDPYVTGVGGTHLTLGGGAYGSETVWGRGQFGSGGGISTIYSLPNWQTGPGTSNSYSNGNREVPDVSAGADSGYSIYSLGKWSVVGGTSAAAPLWAAIAAINNQYATANGKPNLGFANPILYKMFNTDQKYQAYHDVTSGTNLYYPATTGYDMASGIGTPDAYNLIRDINGSGSGVG
jgi:subtilase family serine protease